MKLSNRQAHLLLAVLRDSLTYDIVLPGGGQVRHEIRQHLYNEILGQQGDELFEIDTEPKGHPSHYRNCVCPTCKELRDV